MKVATIVGTRPEIIRLSRVMAALDRHVEHLLIHTGQMEAEGLRPHPAVRLLEPMRLSDHIHLQMHARATLSDSGTITEEASILDFPALNLRDAHEGPEGMEEAGVMMTGLSWDRVRDALRILEDQPRGGDRLVPIPRDDDVPNVAEKVVRIILSDTGDVRASVWKRRDA